VGGRLGFVVGVVSEARDAVALARVNPKVGRSGIGDDGEGLGRGSDSHVNEVLGVHVVLDGDLVGNLVGFFQHIELGLGRHVVLVGERLVLEGDNSGLGSSGSSEEESNLEHYLL